MLCCPDTQYRVVLVELAAVPVDTPGNLCRQNHTIIFTWILQHTGRWVIARKLPWWKFPRPMTPRESTDRTHTRVIIDHLARMLEAPSTWWLQNQSSLKVPLRARITTTHRRVNQGRTGSQTTYTRRHSRFTGRTCFHPANAPWRREWRELHG